MPELIVIGAGPAGVLAAIRAADLGARTVLVTSTVFGGMATNEGPVPVRTLAYAARLLRQVPELGRYGVNVSQPVLDYSRLLSRVHEVVDDVVAHSSLREQIDSLGVTVHEHAGTARFSDAHTVVTDKGLRLQADRIIICAGGMSRPLRVPGSDLTLSPGEAWRLESPPDSMLVIGGGATGTQVASIFRAFGTEVQLFEPGPRILSVEDEDVSAAITAAFRQAGIQVHERFGQIDDFTRSAKGIRMEFSKEGRKQSAEAAMAVVAAGWVADTAGLNLTAAGVMPDQRGFVGVDEYLRTSTPHVFAAGDITGRIMLVPSAMQQGFVAATNAVLGPTLPLIDQVRTGASLTYPEYASAGLTEAQARTSHDILTSTVRFDSTMRTIIDGRKTGFCKLIVDRQSARILGCHIVGERAGEIVQVAALAIATKMRVDELAHVPLAFPTYSGNIAYAAADAARRLELDVSWHGNRPDGVTPDLKALR